MPIKQLQLRGISRTPSDRGTVDGGCAESLNVHLDQQETAPTLPPDDISDDIYGDAATRHPIVYVHKMPSVLNYIGLMTQQSGKGFYAYGEKVTDGAMGGLVIPASETVSSLTSVGNSLIAYTDKSPYYFLFQEGKYKYLGKTIERANLEIISHLTDYVSKGGDLAIPDETLRHDAFITDDQDVKHPDIDVWNNAKAEADENHAGLMATMQAVWDYVALEINERRQEGLFYAPFFIRYALRLYDGSYVNLSTPILCGAKSNYDYDWVQVFLEDRYQNNSEYVGFKMCAFFYNLFKVRIKGTYNIGDWGDIVKSIDIFASSPVYAPNLNASFDELAATATSHNVGQSTHIATRTGFDVLYAKMNAASKPEAVKNEILSKGQFYLIKSINLESSVDMDELESGTMTIENSEDISGDTLFTHEELKDAYRSGVQYLPMSGTLNFNNRALLMGAREKLFSGDAFLNGMVATNDQATGDLFLDSFVLRYKIVNPASGEVNYVFGRYRDGSTAMWPGYLTFSLNADSVQYFGDEEVVADGYYVGTPHSWLCYPDTRCTQVEVFNYYNGLLVAGKIVPMKEHPLLECAYAFLGMGVSLYDLMEDTSYEDAPFQDALANENIYMESANKVLLSEFENPFLFPAGNILTMPDEVIGVGLTSAPLSEGQVGDFDVYVFTAGGIRVLKTNNQGTFSINTAYPTNLSRHIALPGTITSMEQAIVFVTERGVMMLVGGSVTELSATMNGKPYVLDEDLVTLLSGTEWGALAEASANNETLMGFMRTAKIAYDNNGSRLIFFNPEKEYQYVYMLQTQSWHKMLTGVTDPTILNSYPDCLVSHDDTVENFSTVLDDVELLDDEENSVKGLIVTRPIDLGEPDIRKAITSIRIRGRYNRDNVRYVLMGSFDGIHWERLRSLRGGSYKQFRMAILCDLAPTERITWVDIEYEDRFANKLR